MGFRFHTAALAAAVFAVFFVASGASASVPGGDVRLSHDVAGGYVSAWTLATGQPYSDATLRECGVARGRQNEPSVAVNPRDTRVLIGSSNDYCGVYNATDPATGDPVPTGPIWLGYYRSEDSGASFRSSLVPGYPDDTSPFAALADVRTASSGDPVIAWDTHGRVFMGSESSDDPAGSKKTFGDVWVARYVNPAGPNGPTLQDGKRFAGTKVVGRGSAAPFLLGVFNDKTAIEVDRTGGRCDGNVYFAWSRFAGAAGGVQIHFSRSTNHGQSFSHSQNLTPSIHDVQFPDIAVTGNGHIYVTFRQFSGSGHQADAIKYVRSVDCGASFSAPRTITTFTPYDAQDVADPEEINIPDKYRDDPAGEEESTEAGTARDCGDFDGHCQSGYTFFRRDTQVRSTADQLDAAHEWIYLVYDPTKPGTQVATGTTYGSIRPGLASQSGIYYIRLDGATGGHTTPRLIDPEPTGHQLFPDISADGGVLHALWWDSRRDPAYSPKRPVGNDASGATFRSLDVFASRSNDAGATWSAATRITAVASNPNYEQFSNRTVPFAGDYLWVTSLGDFSFGTWTDWRNTVAGADPRENAEDEDDTTADVKQCRTFDASLGAWTGDTCPHAGGLDQNIYGDKTP
jgi:hypothetical protein